jgi:hypothetical protein
MTLDLKMSGANKIIARLKAMQASIDRNKDRAARSAANIVRRAVRREAPKGKPNPYDRKPGTLRRSVSVRKLPELGYVVSPGPLKYLVVKGVRPHDISPKSQPVLRFASSSGDVVFSRVARHPGTPANPFVHRAFDLLTREEAIQAAKTVLRGGAEVGDTE